MAIRCSTIMYSAVACLALFIVADGEQLMDAENGNIPLPQATHTSQRGNHTHHSAHRACLHQVRYR